MKTPTKPARGPAADHHNQARGQGGTTDVQDSRCRRYPRAEHPRLHGQSFLVLAPDYYRGRTAATAEDAQMLRSLVDRSSVNRDLERLIRYLQRRPGSRPAGIAAVGFSPCEVDFHTYPGTGHRFVEEDRPNAYDPSAAREAWAETVAFLREHLPG